MERTEIKNQELARLIENVEKIIIGKRPVIELVVTALLAKGHVLLEDVPGVGKTAMIASLAASCNGVYHRIQMTPDVMPGDITGFSMIRPGSGEMVFQKGAAFCNFLLADEINRASAKSQSALLEIMEESQISQDGTTYRLPEPFMVLATENSVETYGTYHLPEAQMDRFLIKLEMGYPGSEEEIRILQRSADLAPSKLESVMEIEEILKLQKMATEVECAPLLQEYIVQISNATRNDAGIALGVSPRGSLALQKAARAYALLQGRDYVLPDDIKYLAPYVLSHRLLLSPQGKAKWRSQADAVREILKQVEVPVS